MTGAFLVVLISLTTLQTAFGLSYTVCDTIHEEYTTDSPRLTGIWPFYNLLYT